MRIIRVLIIALLLLAVAPGAFAQEAPPTPPHAFLGEVTIDGQPAPVGTTIEARGEGIRTGIPGNPITITEAGRYGGPSPAEEKLIAQGRVSDGATLTFYVNGKPAQCATPGGAWQDSFPFQALAVTPLNLRVGDAAAAAPTAGVPASTPQPVAPEPSPTAAAANGQSGASAATNPPPAATAAPATTAPQSLVPPLQASLSGELPPTPLPDAVLATPTGAPQPPQPQETAPAATAAAQPEAIEATPEPLPPAAPTTQAVAAAKRASPTPLLQARKSAAMPTPVADVAAETRALPVLPVAGGLALAGAMVAGGWYVMRRR